VISAALGMLAHRLEPHRLLRKFYGRELRWIGSRNFAIRGLAPESMKFGSLRARFELATLRLTGLQDE
jgi:hypothetical protein